jgi:transcriptional regulator
MYNLSYFKTSDPHQVIRFMEDHPFAMLMGVNKNNQPVATQVPVFLDEKEGQPVLTGHMMCQTDHHKAFLENPDALMVFTGPHTYISASWYPDPLQASTWNYMSVHVRGKISFLDEGALLEILERTTNHFERNPDAFSSIPNEYIQRMVGAIVAFELKVEKVEHVFKLSQNKDPQTFQAILRHLDKGDPNAIAVAKEMRSVKR